MALKAEVAVVLVLATMMAVPVAITETMRLWQSVAPLLMEELPARDRQTRDVMILLVAVFVSVVTPLPVTIPVWRHDVGPMRVAPLLSDE